MEHGFHEEEFPHDTANTPHIDRRCVLLDPKEKLGRAVPEGDHDGGVGLERGSVLAGQAEVPNLGGGKERSVLAVVRSIRIDE